MLLWDIMIEKWCWGNWDRKSCWGHRNIDKCCREICRGEFIGDFSHVFSESIWFGEIWLGNIEAGQNRSKVVRFSVFSFLFTSCIWWLRDFENQMWLRSQLPSVPIYRKRQRNFRDRRGGVGGGVGKLISCRGAFHRILDTVYNTKFRARKCVHKESRCVMLPPAPHTLGNNNL